MQEICPFSVIVTAMEKIIHQIEFQNLFNILINLVWNFAFVDQFPCSWNWATLAFLK